MLYNPEKLFNDPLHKGTFQTRDHRCFNPCSRNMARVLSAYYEIRTDRLMLEKFQCKEVRAWIEIRKTNATF